MSHDWSIDWLFDTHDASHDASDVESSTNNNIEDDFDTVDNQIHAESVLSNYDCINPLHLAVQRQNTAPMSSSSSIMSQSSSVFTTAQTATSDDVFFFESSSSPNFYSPTSSSFSDSPISMRSVSSPVPTHLVVENDFASMLSNLPTVPCSRNLSPQPSPFSAYEESDDDIDEDRLSKSQEFVKLATDTTTEKANNHPSSEITSVEILWEIQPAPKKESNSSSSYKDTSNFDSCQSESTIQANGRFSIFSQAYPTDNFSKGLGISRIPSSSSSSPQSFETPPSSISPSPTPTETSNAGNLAKLSFVPIKHPKLTRSHSIRPAADFEFFYHNKPLTSLKQDPQFVKNRPYRQEDSGPFDLQRAYARKSRINLSELSRFLQLFDYDISLTKLVEARILEIFHEVCHFNIETEKWNHGVSPSFRERHLDTLYQYTSLWFPEYDTSVLNIVITRASYYKTQQRLRKVKRLGEKFKASD